MPIPIILTPPDSIATEGKPRGEVLEVVGYGLSVRSCGKNLLYQNGLKTFLENEEKRKKLTK